MQSERKKTRSIFESEAPEIQAYFAFLPTLELQSVHEAFDPQKDNSSLPGGGGVACGECVTPLGRQCRGSGLTL